MSSSEQEAAQKEAFEGLVKAVQQRDVLFVLYYLQQLGARCLNPEEGSHRASPLQLALSLPHCPRQGLIVQVLLLSGAAPTQGSPSIASIGTQTSKAALAIGSADALQAETGTARMLLDIPIEDAESWLRQNGLDVEEDIAELDAELDSAGAVDVAIEPQAPTAAERDAAASIYEISSPRHFPQSPTPSPPPLPPPPATQRRGLSPSADLTLDSPGRSPRLGLPKRPATQAVSHPWGSSTRAEGRARPSSLPEDGHEGRVQSQRIIRLPQDSPSTLGRVSSPPSRLPSEMLPSNAAPPQSSALFVSQLSPTTSRESLRAWFAPYGAIVSVDLVPPLAAGGGSANSASGVVDFAINESADTARMELDGCRLDGRFVRIEWVGMSPLGREWRARLDELKSGSSRGRTHSQPSPSPPTFIYEPPPQMAPPTRSELRKRSTRLWRDWDPFPGQLDYSESSSSGSISRSKRSRSSSPHLRRERRTAPSYDEEEDGERGKRVEDEDAEQGEMSAEEGEVREGGGEPSDEEEAELMVTHWGKATKAPSATDSWRRPAIAAAKRGTSALVSDIAPTSP